VLRGGAAMCVGGLCAAMALLFAGGCESGGKRGDGGDGPVRDQQSAAMADSDAERASQRMHEDAEQDRGGRKPATGSGSRGRGAVDQPRPR
jgi:hypothetical protein